MNRRAWLGNRLWQLSCWAENARFQRDLHRLRETQEALLEGVLQRQTPTAFGQRHSLSSIGSYEAFRDRLPVSTYEDLKVDLPSGLTHERVRIWEPTGGSTGGSKWIPWTATLQAEFRRAVAVWIWHLFRTHPEVIAGRSYWQLTPKTHVHAPDWLEGAATGFARDSDYLGRAGRWLERLVLLSVPEGPDLWRRTVETLRRAPDLRLISCWSPTFLLCLHERCREYLGEWRPEQWWPNLRVLSCWTSAASAAYVQRIQELFPGVSLQPKGLLSTECVTTIPVGDKYPLAYRSHFFEFDTGEIVLPAWELQVGQEARVVVSTGGGLTRYDTGDRVRVTGRLGKVPCLEFLGRAGVADLVGEKLSYALMDEAVKFLGGFAMLAYEDGGYVVYTDQPERDTHSLSRLEEILDRCYSYRDAKTLGQLRPLRMFLIEGDPLAQYQRACHQHLGSGEGAVKPVTFHPGQTWSQWLQGRFV